jgi:hypothetical protein
VTCYLLHIMEDPDRDAYRDAGLKDVVGLMPRFFCAQSVKCMRRNAPCWRPNDEPATEGASGPAQGQTSGPGSDSSGGGPHTF